MRCEGSIVSEEQVTHKGSFDFGFGAEASHVEEFTVRRVHTVSSQRHRTGGERRRFQKVSGIRHRPVSRHLIWSKFFKGHGGPHAFVVLGRHPISSLGAGSDPFRSPGQTPWSGQWRLDRAACPVLVTSGVTDAQCGKSCPWWISQPGHSACRPVMSTGAITSIISGGMRSLLRPFPYDHSRLRERLWPCWTL